MYIYFAADTPMTLIVSMRLPFSFDGVESTNFVKSNMSFPFIVFFFSSLSS